MAIAHIQIESVSRSTGGTAVNAVDYALGLGRHVRKAPGILARGHIGPVVDWSQVDAREDRSTRASTAKVARTGDYAFPHELPLAVSIRVFRDHLAGIYERHGLACTFGVHAPPEGGDDRNTHGHPVWTTRRVAADGSLGKKARELDDKKTSGAHIETWRADWQQRINAALVQHGHADAQIDMRSFQRQGRTDLPTRHLGAQISSKVRKGYHSERHARNESIRANRSARAAVERADQEVASLVRRCADRTIDRAMRGVAGSQRAITNGTRARQARTRCRVAAPASVRAGCAAGARSWRERWRQPFRHRIGHVIRTSNELANVLARFARNIRDAARVLMAHESDQGALQRLYRAFQTTLIHNLTPEGFADTYAQTITYGLLTAAISRTEMSEGRHGTALLAENVADIVPVTNPFLKEMLQTFLQAGGRRDGIDFDELGIQDVVELLRGDETDLPAILRDFGNRSRGEDPVIHFYEHFLSAYNKQLKIQRGVFYTPQPVVSYIVRSVHEMLQTEFGLADGLADITTWGEMIRRQPGLKLPNLSDDPGKYNPLPESEPFVQILDPATGTATFLVEVIEVIHCTLVAKWKSQRLNADQQHSAWNNYVPEHLLPRLHAYELMMAPYAIAHMKIGLKLAETGYKFGTEERARIYLTNALEPKSRQLPFIGFAALAHEAAAVNEIKWKKRFTVIIGNPPYSALSANLTTENRRIVDRYRSVNGNRIQERSMLQFEKNIQDDYIKFFAFGQTAIETSGSGILGYVTNHSYLDGPTLRGMRNNLLLTFSCVRLLDLHGNTNKKENADSEDENVFDIQQGVAVALLSKSTTPSETKCQIGHLQGRRSDKYDALERTTFATAPAKRFVPDTENYYFIAFESSLRSEYQDFIPLTSLLRKNLTGTTTGFDSLLMDFDKEVLIAKLERFSDENVPTSVLRDEFSAHSGHSATVLGKRHSISEGKWKELIKPFQLFPFDFRWAFLKQPLLQGHRFDVMENLAPGKPGLLAMRQTKEGFGVFAVTGFCGHKLLGSYDRNYVFPLYDLSFDHLTFLDCKLIHDAQSAETQAELPSELDVFNYIYAILHSPGYRLRYSEFLRIDFPRLPLTDKLDLFRALAQVGSELVALHLLESFILDQPRIKFLCASLLYVVEKISWSRDTVWIDKAQTTGFQGVPEAVWNFRIGGYQVCEKWLKDRRGRVLSEEDCAHYARVVIALAETIRLMSEIDATIERYGGWQGILGNGADTQALNTGLHTMPLAERIALADARAYWLEFLVAFAHLADNGVTLPSLWEAHLVALEPLQYEAELAVVLGANTPYWITSLLLEPKTPAVFLDVLETLAANGLINRETKDGEVYLSFNLQAISVVPDAWRNCDASVIFAMLSARPEVININQLNSGYGTAFDTLERMFA